MSRRKTKQKKTSSSSSSKSKVGTEAKETERVKTKTLKVQIPRNTSFFCSQPLTDVTGSRLLCRFTVSWSQLVGVSPRCDRSVVSVDRSDEMFLPLAFPFLLLLLLLGEVLSGFAVFGGLVGRRGLGGVCTRGQGVGDGHPTRDDSL